MREVTSKDGLGVGIIGLGVMYAIYPWASSEMAGDCLLYTSPSPRDRQ